MTLSDTRGKIRLYVGDSHVHSTDTMCFCSVSTTCLVGSPCQAALVVDMLICRVLVLALMFAVGVLLQLLVRTHCTDPSTDTDQSIHNSAVPTIQHASAQLWSFHSPPHSTVFHISIQQTFSCHLTLHVMGKPHRNQQQRQPTASSKQRVDQYLRSSWHSNYTR
jgi:hypothetical protein